MAVPIKKRSTFSVWSLRLALLALQVLIATLVAHRFLGFPTDVTLNLITTVFAMLATAGVLAVVGFARIWAIGLNGLSRSVAAAMIAAAVLVWPAIYVPTVLSKPALNDVTTDVVNPPPFVAVKELRPRGANSVIYPGTAFATLQADAYTKVRALDVRRPAAEAFEITRKVVERKGWEIVNVIPPQAQGSSGLIEAVASTLIMGFEDDVAVRVSPHQDGSIVDVRSASRFGTHDLGRNAERVADLLKQLEARLETGVIAPDDDDDGAVAGRNSNAGRNRQSARRERSSSRSQTARRTSQGRSRSSTRRVRRQRAQQRAKQRQLFRDIFQPR